MANSSSGKSGSGVKVLVAGSVLQLFLGIIYVWSKFVAPVSLFFAGESADLAEVTKSVKLTSSFMLGFFVLGILVGGRLQGKLKANKIVLLGGLLMAAGMLAASFLPASAPVFLIYIFYGVVGGFGVGMAYNTIISAAQKWFPKKRGLATGISVCAFGFSTVIFAPLVESLIQQFKLANSFRILAAAFAVVTVALFSFITLPEAQAAASAAQALPESRQFTTGQALKTKEFYFIALSLGLATAAFFILNPSVNALSTNILGFAPQTATAIVMMTGIASALGRLAVPALADKIGREMAALAIVAGTSLGALVMCINNQAVFAVAVAVLSFCYGGFSGVYPLITADWFGIKNVGSNYGAVMIGFAASALFFPMIVGQFNTAEGATLSDNVPKLITLAVLAVVGVVLLVLLQAAKKSKKSGAAK